MLGRVSLEDETSFKGGALWRVGSGEKINIWQQCWLRRKHQTYLPTCPLESFENHTIDLLIDPSTRRWNEEMVDGLFVEEDAKLIKKIPLSRHVTKDTLYWPYSTSGTYSCKSGYRFLKEEEELQLNSKLLQFVISGFGRKYGRCKLHQR